MQKIGKWGSMLTLLLMALLSMAIVALIAASVIISFDATILERFIDETKWEFNIARMGIVAVLLLCVVSLTILNIAVYLANRTFEDLRTSHTPFKPQYANNMKSISILVFISGLMVLNITLVVVAILLYCFSRAFEYGADLQRDSDEIL